MCVSRTLMSPVQGFTKQNRGERRRMTFEKSETDIKDFELAHQLV